MFGRSTSRIALLLEDFSSYSVPSSAVLLKGQLQAHVQRAPLLSWLQISVIGVTTLVSYFFGLLPFVGGLFLVLVFGKYVRQELKRRKEFESFDRDFPVFLSAVASAVRAGDDPWRAFVESGKLFHKNSPIFREVDLIRERVDAGAREHEALLAFGVSTNHPDLKLLRGAFELALKNGSSLAECLVRLARVSRQRQSFKRKIRAALAMQRLSSIGIGLSALAICIFQLITNKSSVINAWHSATGGPLLKAGLALLFLGLIWMTRIGREVLD